MTDFEAVKVADLMCDFYWRTGVRLVDRSAASAAGGNAPVAVAWFAALQPRYNASLVPALAAVSKHSPASAPLLKVRFGQSEPGSCRSATGLVRSLAASPLVARHPC